MKMKNEKKNKHKNTLKEKLNKTKTKKQWKLFGLEPWKEINKTDKKWKQVQSHFELLIFQ